MENHWEKPWILGKLRLFVGFLWFVFCFAGLIGRFVEGGKEFFRNDYMVGIQNILIYLLLLIWLFDFIHSLIYDKEATIERLKNFWTKKRIIDVLIPIIFGILLIAIWYFSQH